MFQVMMCLSQAIQYFYKEFGESRKKNHNLNQQVDLERCRRRYSSELRSKFNLHTLLGLRRRNIQPLEIY